MKKQLPTEFVLLLLILLAVVEGVIVLSVIHFYRIEGRFALQETNLYLLRDNATHV